MPLHLSQSPGRRERHLLRKRNNPLFPQAERQLTESQLATAQRLDHEELEGFIGDFHRLVHRAVSLQPNVGSEVILELKEALDQAYERAAGLADDQRETRQAIQRLLELLMDAIRKGAQDDPVALGELEQETIARRTHFELLQHPLIADLLDPETPIAQHELAATLLSANDAELTAALSLFDENQRALLYRDAERLLKEAGVPPSDPLWRRLALFAP